MVKKTDSDKDLIFEIKKPLRDFHIFQPPKVDIKIVKGELIKVPEKFKINLINENVIER